jgi:GNAT superfamily N-acetyltransferase
MASAHYRGGAFWPVNQRFAIVILVQYQLRTATHADRAALRTLIERSARELGAADYRPEQIEGALQGAFGVDTQLIDDGTYFVAEAAGRLVGCGGWSWRRTLFGGDSHSARNASELDPRTDAAKIRAFFIDPDYARRGIGRALLQRCEAEARERGFTRFELMGTLPGVRLYQALGYVPGELMHYPVAPGVTIEFVPMHKAAGGR